MATQTSLIFESPVEGSSVEFIWDDVELTCSGGNIQGPTSGIPFYIIFVGASVLSSYWAEILDNETYTFSFSSPLTVVLATNSKGNQTPTFDLAGYGFIHCAGTITKPVGYSILSVTANAV